MLFKISDFKVLEVRASQKREIIDYGIEMVGAPLEWNETMGEGTKVGVIDTGIDLSHDDLKGRVKDYVNYTSSDRKDITDENGHGTHVAGIIAAERNNIGVVGVAPKTDIYIAKAFDKDGTANFEAIRESLIWMMEKDVDVINMSFSSETPTNEYQQVIEQAYRRGITLVCAAGNRGEKGNENTIGYPARFDEAIAVTAVDISKKITDFSSIGPEAEIAAAGNKIYSCYPKNKYATLSGTSMATPVISGAIAILQSKGLIRYYRRLTPAEIRLLLHIYAEDLGDIGRNPDYGFGLFSFGRINKTDYVYHTSSTPTVRYNNGIDLLMYSVIAGILMR